MGSSSGPRAAITDFQVHQAIEACMRRLPDGLRFAPPGARAHIARQIKRHSPSLSMVLHQSLEDAGRVINMSSARLHAELCAGPATSKPSTRRRPTHPVGLSRTEGKRKSPGTEVRRAWGVSNGP